MLLQLETEAQIAAIMPHGVDERVHNAQQRRATIALTQQLMLSAIVELRDASKIEGNGKTGSSAPESTVVEKKESASSKYMRGLLWVKIVSAVSRLAVCVETVQDIRDIKNNDIHA